MHIRPSKQNLIGSRLGLHGGQLDALLWAARSPREFRSFLVAVESLRMRGMLACDGTLTDSGRETFGQAVEFAAEPPGNQLLAAQETYPW